LLAANYCYLVWQIICFVVMPIVNSIFLCRWSQAQIRFNSALITPIAIAPLKKSQSCWSVCLIFSGFPHRATLETGQTVGWQIAFASKTTLH